MKAEDKPEIIIYEGDDSVARVEVRLEGETVWLTQAQLAQLFGTTKQNVGQHVKHIIVDGELSEEATVKKIFTVQLEGGRRVEREIEHYNLDMIISLGYRVNSRVATRFRQWATVRLREYIVKGFAMDDERLKGEGGGGYWKELLERIRDIRSSEKALYRQVLDLYALSVDYDPKARESVRFFKVVQNKLHYAVHGQTAAEVVHDRADAGKDFMGLTTFAGAVPTLREVVVAKNYLTEDELFVLNRLVSAFFDLAEVKAREHVKMYMRDWVGELDRFVGVYGKGVLRGSGRVSGGEAERKAAGEYRKYQARSLSPVERAYLDSVRCLAERVEKRVKKV